MVGVVRVVGVVVVGGGAGGGGGVVVALLVCTSLSSVSCAYVMFRKFSFLR